MAIIPHRSQLSKFPTLTAMYMRSIASTFAILALAATLGMGISPSQREIYF
jgi:hypothetical protein